MDQQGAWFNLTGYLRRRTSQCFELRRSVFRILMIQGVDSRWVVKVKACMCNVQIRIGSTRTSTFASWGDHPSSIRDPCFLIYLRLDYQPRPYCLYIAFSTLVRCLHSRALSSFLGRVARAKAPCLTVSSQSTLTTSASASLVSPRLSGKWMCYSSNSGLISRHDASTASRRGGRHGIPFCGQRSISQASQRKRIHRDCWIRRQLLWHEQASCEECTRFRAQVYSRHWGSGLSTYTFTAYLWFATHVHGYRASDKLKIQISTLYTFLFRLQTWIR